METKVHCLSVSGTVLDALLSTLNREVSDRAKISTLRKGGVGIQSKVSEPQKPIQKLSMSPAGASMCVSALPWPLRARVLPFLLFSLFLHILLLFIDLICLFI